MKYTKYSLESYCNIIDTRLNEILEKEQKPYSIIYDAIRHSLSAGGKRIRPILALEFYRLCGGKNDIINIACAIEMIHTFSLIHDDLPCMDDDDFRRGKPSCHKLFGEAYALLAGDALATLPYEIITNEAINNNISYEVAVKVVNELSKAVGAEGMIAGQVIDILNEGKAIDSTTLSMLDSLKTGELIRVSCKIGCILANANESQILLAEDYAKNIGVAFQIVDDILDVTSTFEKLGKPINSDTQNNKSTYVSIFGLEKAKEKAKELTQNALAILSEFDDNDFMLKLTNMLLTREN